MSVRLMESAGCRGLLTRKWCEQSWDRNGKEDETLFGGIPVEGSHDEYG